MRLVINYSLNAQTSATKFVRVVGTFFLIGFLWLGLIGATRVLFLVWRGERRNVDIFIYGRRSHGESILLIVSCQLFQLSSRLFTPSVFISAIVVSQRLGSVSVLPLDLYLTDESAMPLSNGSITSVPTPGHVLNTARRRLSLSSTHHFRNEEIYGDFGST